jgi:hypothetical protein
MSFGKSFRTRKEANEHLRKMQHKGLAGNGRDFTVRKMSKKDHPRRKKLFHVGGFIDFLNFA